ncbi:nuclear transcription factor Y subunit C-9-like isoform X2 [Diospyros lotus]|uniref:nuclear transcription factor Y subunit C-9-like isoform X2 n=1 Tax=Diospyros lotus TaxID=55363 RepID=UPI00225549F7|nr:nuclear transcription factor Y subunit C-9-like isoform X2 [Diospyros lotus]
MTAVKNHTNTIYVSLGHLDRMDQQGHGQPQGGGVVGSAAQLHYGTSQYEPNQVTVNPSRGPVVTSVGTTQSPTQQVGSHLGQHQLAYQHIHQQQQLQQQLQNFWASQYQEIEKVTDFKNHSLPLARIKKIMKADEDVRMISAEAPIVFARACEMFILELTLRSWNHTEENKRRTLQKNDIAAAITRTDIFDFLVDIVPREDLKDEALASIPRGTVPVGGPTDAYPYYYMPPQHSPQAGAPGMIMGKPMMDPALYAPQTHPYMAQPMWPQAPQPPQSPSES